MIQEEASIPASFVHCGPHSFTLTSFVYCWRHSFIAGHIRSVLDTSVHPYLIRSLLTTFVQYWTHPFIADSHSFIAGPHSFSAGPHSFIAGPHSFIADSHPFIAAPHSFIPGHIFHLKNWFNCHLQEKLVVDNNPKSAKLEEVSIVQNVTI